MRARAMLEEAIERSGRSCVGFMVRMLWAGAVVALMFAVNVTAIANNAGDSELDGPGLSAELSLPSGVAVDARGNVYVTDSLGNTIRKIVCRDSTAKTCSVSTIAGDGAKGERDGPGRIAEFNYPRAIAIDKGGALYVADGQGATIRKIVCVGPTASFCSVTTLAGNGTEGERDGLGTGAEFSVPTAIAVDSRGYLYVADEFGNTIREVACHSANSKNCTVTTLAGSGAAGEHDGSGANAEFDRPTGIAIDARGYLYIADEFGNAIRQVVCHGRTESFCSVRTLAGNGTEGERDGLGTGAEFSSPTGIAVDSRGNLYVADHYGYTIRKIVCHGSHASDCTVTTMAGNGIAYERDGPARQAEFWSPIGITVDARGNLYVADNRGEIREITCRSPTGTSCTVTTLAGHVASEPVTGAG